MDKLLTLLTLQRQAQEAKTQAQFWHIVANESRKLIDYRHAIIWKNNHGKIGIEKISGNATIDPQGLYALEIKSILKDNKENKQNVFEKYKEKENSCLTFAPMTSDIEGNLGGICFETEKPYSDQDKQIIAELAASYTPRALIENLRKDKSLLKKIMHGIAYKKRFLIVALAICFFPVRLTATAPMEVSAKDAEYLTIPFNGTVEKVFVNPGDFVEKDQIVIKMDDTLLLSEWEMASESLKVSKASLSRLRKEALTSPEKKIDLAILESEIAEKKIRADYASFMQKRSEIRAKKSGVAVFSDKKTWEGKPVEAGTAVVKIADQDNVEIIIRVPVESMISLSENKKINYFLNINPTRTYQANIESIGYEASIDADGLLTYKIIASPHDYEGLRIGWQGTAKIAGEWSILGYMILRRPILVFRQITGL